MSYDTKKLLPKSLRDGRWGELIEVVQSVIQDIKTDKIDIIKLQYELENMTDQQKIDLASSLGYEIVTLGGYTSTSEYLKKQILTLVPRIKNKTTPISYQSIFNIYNLLGFVSPTWLNPTDNKLVPILNFDEFNENPAVYDTLDAGADFVLFRIPKRFDTDDFYLDGGYTFDEYYEVTRQNRYSELTNATLDTEEFPNLDMESYMNYMTRHLLINYKFNFVESPYEFISENTLRALYNDILFNKRKTEVPYFEPCVCINTKNDGTLTTETILKYDGLDDANIYSILIGSSLEDVTKIKFGLGAHSTIDSSITDVKFLVYEINANSIYSSGSTPSHFFGRKKISQKNKFSNFSEIALFDSGNNCIFYATFPTIKTLSQMYSNVAWDITLVTP